MKRVFFIMLIFLGQCVFWLAGEATAEAAVALKKVGVLELENKTLYPNLGKMGSAAITVHLLKNRSCDILPQEELAAAFEQRGVKPKGVVDPAVVSSIGEAAGLDYIITGSIVGVKAYSTPGYWRQTKFGPQYVQGNSGSSANLELMMIDAKTAQIVWMGKVEGRVSGTTAYADAIEDGGYQTVRQLYRFMPLQGSIVGVVGEKYKIDLNMNDAIGNGDLLSPAFPAAPTPAAGAEKKQAVILKVVEVNDTYCIAEVKKGNAEVLKEVKVGTLVSKHFKTVRGVLGARKTESLKQTAK